MLIYGENASLIGGARVEEITMEPTLYIRLLGDFSLVYADRQVAGLNSMRLQSLLAYLVLHHDAPQQRQHLAFLF